MSPDILCWHMSTAHVPGLLSTFLRNADRQESAGHAGWLRVLDAALTLLERLPKDFDVPGRSCFILEAAVGVGGREPAAAGSCSSNFCSLANGMVPQ